MPPEQFTVAQLADCADREVRQRKRVYQRMLVQGKMTHVQADREISMMTAIRDKLIAEAEANPQDSGRLF